MIKRLTQALITKFIPDANQNTYNDLVRAKYGLLEGWLSVILNTILFIIKLTMGLMINSLALIADAFHTLSDILTSAIIISTFKISQKPPDAEHPYGHGRAEYIATLMIAVLLVVTAIEFVRSAIERMLDPHPYTISWWMIGILIVTIIAKEILSRVSMNLGELIDSKTLEADAWHHRTDAISSLFVIAAMLLSPLGFPYFDSIAALLVAIILAIVGINLARDAADTLMGKPPTPEFIQTLRNTAKEVEHVIDAHDIVVHTYGHNKFAGLHIEISDKINPMQAHDISEEVEHHLLKTLNTFSTVHVDLIPMSDANIQKFRDYLHQLKNDFENFTGFHDIRFENENLSFEIGTKEGLSENEIQTLKESLIAKIAVDFPNIRPSIFLPAMHKKH